MKTADILKIRLYNQLLAGNQLTRPAEIVSWLGAMQSQNYEMAKWGIGARLPGVTNKQVEEAVSTGEIIRTHILRPTWHFVAAEDIHWMHELSAPRLKPTFVSYDKMRGMEEDFIQKGLKALPGILDKYGHLTREEIAEHLTTSHGLRFVENHNVKNILSRAELEGIVCNGEIRENKQTYALLHQRVPKTYSLSKEEALERLARKYFSSHGPATLDDFLWWSGLTKTDVRKGIEAIKHDFVCEEINGKTYWMPNNIQTPAGKKSTVLLPAFDEYVVSYKYREEIIDEAYYRKVLTINGIFSPTVHYNGKIVGTWKRVVKKKGAEAELSFFETTPEKVHSAFDKAVKAYNKFNIFP
ncbi:winged helix DNA-binding domain-containing protein [Bacteroides sp. 519]|uniref:winged helix DNA-binding domain-containing protein n=1 Tax=Bacteroides sp. 519 TaxID=2302937 RepID=UPI0013D39875|nr:winged helix DNA-binding domain-containing protein [Bacteroides sp. 519]NDV59358.1 winged helix DNA-binding domain-containing protein [Bacteroides sp. 519]